MGGMLAIPCAVDTGVESSCLAIQQERLLISHKTDIALQHMYSIIVILFIFNNIISNKNTKK